MKLEKFYQLLKSDILNSSTKIYKFMLLFEFQISILQFIQAISILQNNMKIKK